MAGSVQVVLLLLVGLVGALATDGNMAASGYSANWEQGHATWYGDPYGEGSTGNDSPPQNFIAFYVPVPPESSSFGGGPLM